MEEPRQIGCCRFSSKEGYRQRQELEEVSSFIGILTEGRKHQLEPANRKIPISEFLEAIFKVGHCFELYFSSDVDVPPMVFKY